MNTLTHIDALTDLRNRRMNILFRGKIKIEKATHIGSITNHSVNTHVLKT